MDWDHRAGAQQLGGNRCLVGVHAGGQRARRLSRRKVDDRSSGRQKDHVERSVPFRDQPPPAVEQGVSGVERPTAVRGDAPGDLRIAEAVHGREGGDLEGSDLDRLPSPYDSRRKVAFLDLGFRLPTNAVSLSRPDARSGLSTGAPD